MAAPNLNIIKRTLRATLLSIAVSAVMPEIQTAIQVGDIYNVERVSYRHMMYWKNDGGSFGTSEVPRGFGSIVVKEPQMTRTDGQAIRIEWRLE